MRSRRVVMLGVALVLALAACAEAGDTTTTGAPPTSAAGDGTVEVTLVDYAFSDLPASVPAGTTFSIVNESEAELHEMVVFKLPEGEERSAAEIIALPEEEAGALLGEEAVMVLLAPPGGEQITAVGDGTVAEPGNYVIFCAIPTGVDPQEFLDAAAAAEGGPPVIEGAGPPHFVNGMIADLVVEG